MIASPAPDSDGVLTPEQLAIRDRMLYDFRFFCSKLKIRIKNELAPDEDEGILGPFVWNEAQEIVWARMERQLRQGVPVRLVILKARQFGISTFFCAWLFWWMWRKSHVRALIAAHKTPTLGVMLETMNRFYESFPVGFRPQLRQKSASARVSKEEVYLADRHSGCMIVPARKDAARGDALDLALCTEVSSYDDAEEFFGGFTPAMGRRRDTTLIMESSPQAGWFWQRYKTSKRYDQDVFLPWMVCRTLYAKPIEEYWRHGRSKGLRDARTKEPVTFTQAERAEQKTLTALERAAGRGPVGDAQMYWRQDVIETEFEGDEEWFHQEFPRDDISCFERQIRSAFKSVLPLVRATVEEMLDEADAEDCAMGRLESTTVTDPQADPQVVEFVEDDQVDLERYPGIAVYRWPKAGYTYTVGVDVADDIGTSADEDEANFSVCSVYCCDTHEQVAEWRGGMDPHEFGDEVAKVGYFYNSAMICVEYNNMGVTTIDRLTKYLEYPNRFRWPKWDEGGKFTKKEMWVTDPKTKQLMIGSLRYAVKSGKFKVRSPGLQEEMTGYQVENGKYTASADTYADRIMAAALAWQCVEQTDYAASIVQSASPEEPRGRADGQARRVLKESARNVYDVPPQLPDDLAEELGVQDVEDLYAMMDL